MSGRRERRMNNIGCTPILLGWLAARSATWSVQGLSTHLELKVQEAGAAHCDLWAPLTVQDAGFSVPRDSHDSQLGGHVETKRRMPLAAGHNMHGEEEGCAEEGSSLVVLGLAQPHEMSFTVGCPVCAGVRCIVTLECTEARAAGATPSRYTTQKVQQSASPCLPLLCSCRQC